LGSWGSEEVTFVLLANNDFGFAAEEGCEGVAVDGPFDVRKAELLRRSLSSRVRVSASVSPGGALWQQGSDDVWRR